MSRKLGIVELAAHNEVVWAYANILLQLTEEITVFTNRFTYDQLYDLHEDTRISWEIQDGESNVQFMEKSRVKLDAMDSVIFSTILPPDFEFFTTLSLQCKTYYVIHDANYFFFPKDNFFLRDGLVNASKDFIKRLRFYFKNEERRNLGFLKSFTGLLVPAQSVFDHLDKQGLTKEYNFPGVMNFAVNKEAPKLKQNRDGIHIVIPGSISNKSRDYQPVINALAKTDLTCKTKVVFLGRAMDAAGEKTVSKIKKLNRKNLEVKTFSSFIQQAEFDEIMENATFLILPVNETMKISTIKEQNGYTCVSGNINDMIKYGKRSLIPSYYPVDPSMQDMISSYKNEDELADKISSFASKVSEEKIKNCLALNSAAVVAKKVNEFLLLS